MSGGAKETSERLNEARHIRLAGGRRLCYRDAGGGEEAYPIIALHGTPGSRLKFIGAEATSARLGLRLITSDRWGYGCSEAPEEPRLEDYPRDVAELTSRLGIGSFAVLGVSGGAPYAVAVAAGLGARIKALALVSPVGPIAGSCSWHELGSFHALCFRVLPKCPGATSLLFRAYRRLLGLAPASAMRLASCRSVGVDANVLRDPVLAQQQTEAFRAGLESGVRGPEIDMHVFSRPWSLSLETVTGRTRVWLGDADRNVPQVAARRLASAIPGSELTMLAGQGHHWILRNYEVVLGWLAHTVGAQAASGRRFPERPPAG